MDRILEPEIMNGEDQVSAYAKADFSEENQEFVDRFLSLFPNFQEGSMLDLGCGPADIPIRFCQRLSKIAVLGVDASLPMLATAQRTVRQAKLDDRITFLCRRIQELTLEHPPDAIISNSVTHHIPNPFQFWYAVKTLAKPGSPVLVMDLLRPESPEEAQALVTQYAGRESEQLQHDFYASLLAAFSEDEVAAHLAELNLSRLLIDVPNDRHWLVYGRI